MGKKVSLKGKKEYATYKSLGKYTINKKKKLARHLKKFPNDAQAAEALKVVGSSKPRSTPKKMQSRWNPWLPKDAKGKLDLTKVGKIHLGPYSDGTTSEMYILVRPTLNKMCGGIGTFGRFVQHEERVSKSNRKVMENDPKGKLLPKGTVLVGNLQPTFATTEDKQRFTSEYRVKEKEVNQKKKAK